jgi:hypothetical protein
MNDCIYIKFKGTRDNRVWYCKNDQGNISSDFPGERYCFEGRSCPFYTNEFIFLPKEILRIE